jgi:predicted RNA-binding protein with PIN domain
MTVSPDALPEQVRARVIAYAADALGVLPPDQVPAPLKRAAAFTPQRRARLAGQQVLDLLIADDSFRERLAVQARARQGEAAAQLAAGETSVAAAALAYLTRPEGWEQLVAATSDRPDEGSGPRPGTEQELVSLRHRLDAALEEQARLKRAAKDGVAAVKADNTELRRKLGESRARARDARADVDRISSETSERVSRLEAEAASAQAELRRLRAQVAGLEDDLARAQRAARAGREEATVRARLLLDTLIEAGQGLRKELALPVTTGSPADQVEAHLAEAGARDSSGTASLPLDDPALVRELLTLPRLHLVVDGYNVTRAEWDDTALENQRERLLRGLAPLAARTGAEITVVFDGTHAEIRPLVRPPRGVRVLFSPRGVLADDVIRDLVAAEPAGRPVLVVTSDQEIVRVVSRQAGVRVVAARALVRLLAG